MKRVVFCLLFMICGTGLINCSAEIPAVPESFSFVFDYAGIMTESDKAAICTYGQELLTFTGGSLWGDEVIAVIVESLDGIDGGEYVTRIINEWGTGDNSAVVLLATVDREIQIGVGKGLDEKLNNHECSLILDTNLSYFANNDFSTGMLLVYRSVCNRIREIRLSESRRFRSF